MGSRQNTMIVNIPRRGATNLTMTTADGMEGHCKIGPLLSKQCIVLIRPP